MSTNDEKKVAKALVDTCNATEACNGFFVIFESDIRSKVKEIKGENYFEILKKLVQQDFNSSNNNVTMGRSVTISKNDIENIRAKFNL